MADNGQFAFIALINLYNVTGFEAYLFFRAAIKGFVPVWILFIGYKKFIVRFSGFCVRMD